MPAFAQANADRSADGAPSDGLAALEDDDPAARFETPSRLAHRFHEIAPIGTAEPPADFRGADGLARAAPAQQREDRTFESFRGPRSFGVRQRLT